jgi:hypothetical protein
MFPIITSSLLVAAVGLVFLQTAKVRLCVIALAHSSLLIRTKSLIHNHNNVLN